MPFTFAHPLYALPFKMIKPRYFSAWGLVLGSMSPDFEYFLALEPYQTIGHTHKGLWLHAIPMSVLFVLLFSFVLKTMALHLPSVFQLDRKLYAALRTFPYRSMTSWIQFLICVVIGFYSHVFIDSFTHASGHFVTREPALQQPFHHFPVYKWLQHSLSAAGLALELVVLFLLLKKAPAGELPYQADSSRKTRYWLVVPAVAITVISLKFTLTDSANILGILVVSSISGTILGVAAASTVFYRKRDYS